MSRGTGELNSKLTEPRLYDTIASYALLLNYYPDWKFNYSPADRQPFERDEDNHKPEYMKCPDCSTYSVIVV